MFVDGPLELAENAMPAEFGFEDSFEFLEKKRFPSCEEKEPEREIDLAWVAVVLLLSIDAF